MYVTVEWGDEKRGAVRVIRSFKEPLIVELLYANPSLLYYSIMTL